MWIILSLFIIAFIVLLLTTELGRYAKTAYLILRVTPYEQTVADAPRILVTGDSTAYGTGATAGRYSVGGYLGAEYSRYSVANNSTNGRTIDRQLRVLRELPETTQYELILLQIGANDIIGNRPKTTVRTELQALHEAALLRANHVVMISSGNVGAAVAFVENGEPNATLQTRAKTYQEIYANVASETGVTYVDLFESVADDPFFQKPKVYLSIDGLHPSNRGYRYWYERLQPYLENILTEV